MQDKNGPIGIIDIGSNSIRFVAFEKPWLGQKPFINEKVQCGLGQDINETGHLYSPGKALAQETLTKFKSIAENANLQNLIIIGTAALRDASDGKIFAEAINKTLGLNINIISGEDEARYSGLGVLSHFKEAQGIAGDLGGGSLELVNIQTTSTVSNATSLPIGVLRTKAQCSDSENYIKEHMQTIPQAMKNQDDFYAIGGTWRALATAHAHDNQNPGADGSGLNGYTMSSPELLEYTKSIIQKSAKEMVALYGLEKRRAKLLPTSALIMAHLLETLQPKRIIISTAGLRDGVLSDKLNTFENAA